MEVNQIIQGDCLEVLKDLPDNFVDAIVTDPPAGIGFMGREWDSDKGGREEWITWLTKVMSEGLRVLKPGGHALVWALPRTSHWTGTALENAGFEVRDCVYHLFGSGFPKNLDISKAIDKRNGRKEDNFKELGSYLEKAITDSDSTCAKRIGFSPALVRFWRIGERIPNKETWLKLKDLYKLNNTFDWIIEREEAERKIIKKRSRTPVNDGRGNVYGNYGTDASLTEPATPEAKQWEGWGTALKPAVECWWLVRKPLSEKTVAENVLKHGTGGLNIDESRILTEEDQRRPSAGGDNGLAGTSTFKIRERKIEEQVKQNGRFPSHLIHDGSEVILKELNDEARFFYTAKPSSSEKNLMYGEFEERKTELNSGGIGRKTSVEKRLADGGINAPIAKNFHPTVKAQSLMQYLIKLITPPKGIVLDMFAGSGSTLLAAKTLGHPYIGIEIDPDYCKIAEARMGQQTLNF